MKNTELWDLLDCQLDLNFAESKYSIGRSRPVLGVDSIITPAHLYPWHPQLKSSYAKGGGWDFTRWCYRDNARFTNNRLLTVTRSTVGTAENVDGTSESFAVDVPRITDKGLLIEAAATNQIRNNSMQGAVAGTPGTDPDNWGNFAVAGLTQQITGVGTESGVDYIDIRFSGTTNSTAVTIPLETPNTQVAALTDEVWNLSAWLKLVDGTFTNVTAAILRLQECTSGGSAINTGNTSPNLTITSTWTRHSRSRTLNGGVTTAAVNPRISFTVTNGAAVDFTIRIGWPQLETGSLATSAIRTTTAAVTRSADLAQVMLFSTWFDRTRGILVVDWDDIGTAAQNIATLSDGTNDETIFIATSGADVTAADVIVGGVSSGGAELTVVRPASQ